MTPLIHRVGAVLMLLALVALAVATRMRSSRDRRRIGEELKKHRCRLVSAKMLPSRSRLLGAAAYDIEYRDDEDDPAQAACTVKRGIITWADHLFDSTPYAAPTNVLPVYGQNWRG